MTKSTMWLVNTATNTTELAEKKYSKQALRYGEWDYQGEKLKVDEEYVAQIVKNFKEKQIENVPILAGHHEMAEVEVNPALYLGDVTELQQTDKGLDIIFTVKDDTKVGEVYKNISVGLIDNYTNHENGENVGTVINHVAMVVEPYIKGLDGFIALSEKSFEVKELDLDKDSTESPPVADETVIEAEKVEDKEPEAVILSEQDQKVKELTEELAKVKDRERKLAEKVALEKANAKYQKLLSEGKILPVQKESAILLLSDKNHSINLSDKTTKSVAKLFSDFLDKMPKIISFEEEGSTLPEEPQKNDPLKNLSESDKEGFKKLYKDKWEEKALEAIEQDK